MRLNVKFVTNHDGKTGKRIRTLVVDDSATARCAVCSLLELQPGIEVVGSAADGYQALDRINALHPDLILMDIQMPNLNGLEVMERLREQHSLARVIMISIHGGAETEARCKECGADGFVSKDRLPQSLLAEIGRVIGKNQ